MSDSPPPDMHLRRFRVNLAAALIGGVTLLILLGVGSALWTTLSSARTNTFSLLGQRATMTQDLLEARISGELQPVANGGADLAAQFADGRLNLDDRRQRTFDTFTGVLTALPQTTGVVYVRPDMTAMTVSRREGFPIEVPQVPALRARQEYALSAARSEREPFWGPPLWLSAVNQAVLTHLSPVWRGDEFHGVVVVSVTLGKISEFLKSLEQAGDQRAFILYGNDRILAHPNLDDASFELSEDEYGNPLPRMDQLNDPAFRLVEGGGQEASELLAYAPDLKQAQVNDELLVITRETTRFGPNSWTLAVEVPLSTVAGELSRLRDAAIAGGLILILAVTGGFLFARMLNRQIGRLATAAAALTRLDTGNTPSIPDSRILELSQAARAFNALTNTLHWFEIYVPKQLVLRLMEGSDQRVRTEARDLTVMFTDIRGFSTLAEHMEADEIASLLNEHFTMLADAIEAEGGTVDKFIGDAIMAFWGAPTHMDDHAARGLRAAADIQQRVRASNADRRAAGQPPLRVRIGIHAGPVVVGNIGSRSRVNYTIVGDTVNTASRIDSLAKEMDREGDCVVLVSEDVVQRVAAPETQPYSLSPLGERDIRGREGTVHIFSLEARPAGDGIESA